MTEDRTVVSRRTLLSQTGFGLNALALLSWFGLGVENAAHARPCPMEKQMPKVRNAPPAKAKRVIQLFMNGGASQMDLLITSRCSKNGMERSLIQGRAIASKRRPASQVRYSGPLFRSLDMANRGVG